MSARPAGTPTTPPASQQPVADAELALPSALSTSNQSAPRVAHADGAGVRSSAAVSLLLSLSVLVGWVSVVVMQLRAHVPEPYMDEVFHVRQTQRYCNRSSLVHSLSLISHSLASSFFTITTLPQAKILPSMVQMLTYKMEIYH